MKFEYISYCEADTEKIAFDFAQQLLGGEIIAFTGGLGMGKTCFTRGLARGLGFTGDVSSPTFAIVNEYRGGRLDIFHFDMYRVNGWEDLYSTGYFEYTEEGGVVVVEWSENIASALDTHNTVFVRISQLDKTTRKIIISKGE